jgi:hypothetical protein
MMLLQSGVTFCNEEAGVDGLTVHEEKPLPAGIDTRHVENPATAPTSG